MNSDNKKLIAILFFVLPLLLLAVFRVAPVKVTANAGDDPAVKYKASCQMCHTATASKSFDATKADAELVKIVMDGKAGKMPPMPGFKAKGMTEAEATALVAYMKTLVAAPK